MTGAPPPAVDGTLDEAEVRNALDDHVGASAWLRRGFARTMKIEDLRPTHMHRVILESLLETRAAATATHPFKEGQKLSLADSRPAPPIWDIPVDPPPAVKDEFHQLRLPFSEVIADCPRCPPKHPRDNCPDCAETGRIVNYTRLDIIFAVHRAERAVGATTLPPECLGLAAGEVAYEEEAPRLEPTLGTAPSGPFRGGTARLDAAVDEATNALLESERFSSDTRLHRQRLTVRRVPITVVTYRDGARTRTLHVYGTNRRVNAPGFPWSIPRLAIAASGLAALAAGIAALGR